MATKTRKRTKKGPTTAVPPSPPRRPVPSPLDAIPKEDFARTVMVRHLGRKSGRPILDLWAAFRAFMATRSEGWGIFLTGEQRYKERHPTELRSLYVRLRNMPVVLKRRSLIACESIKETTDPTPLHESICECADSPLPGIGGLPVFIQEMQRLVSVQRRLMAVVAVSEPSLMQAVSRHIAAVEHATSRLQSSRTELDVRRSLRAIVKETEAAQECMNAEVAKLQAQLTQSKTAVDPAAGRIISQVKAARMAECAERTIARWLDSGKLKRAPSGGVDESELIAKLPTLRERHPRVRKRQPPRHSADIMPSKTT
ncbi:MAG: hypothetical protein WC718_12870 [Phycisphaerales bacterium]